MPDEPAAEIAIDGESSDAQAAIENAAAPVEELGAKVEQSGEPAGSRNAESPPDATPQAPSAVASAAIDALHAAAEQVTQDRGVNAGDQAALAQALRTFLDAFAAQNAPTRSEFRDLAARLDRLSSQYAKGR